MSAMEGGPECYCRDVELCIGGLELQHISIIGEEEPAVCCKHWN